MGLFSGSGLTPSLKGVVTNVVAGNRTVDSIEMRQVE